MGGTLLLNLAGGTALLNVTPLLLNGSAGSVLLKTIVGTLLLKVTSCTFLRLAIRLFISGAVFLSCSMFCKRLLNCLTAFLIAWFDEAIILWFRVYGLTKIYGEEG